MSGTKIKSLKALARICEGLKKKARKTVFTNGCFDILHYGHVMYLEKAKAKGDFLIVAVNSDASVRRIKGRKRPIVNEADRARVVAGLESVDYVVVFDEDTPLKVIEAVKPDVLVKGADWRKKDIVGADFVRENGGSIYSVKLAGGRSTTGLIKKICANS